ncbi:MAG: D-alanine--D-alanine ligase [Acidibacillus sp.]|uniref:D-alanine--D-alanine ligase n=1 Tax=Sulfoacidibacillus ferrooxidans TaxID=2005001 RepID=A0A9X1VAQ2_9BACL|nr:D-alanine--D-alanine ligase [Sulfoacidibacillus ferrooxidans]MCI0184335.1 D-alanine--D-alanine ligase B [Sulfoacidibacillus ferrooxidans]MCY0894280.1 D-alanine--D-alanine ligase [Acidibacillus sp.]
MKIVVLYGGRSAEREVSLMTGREMIRALSGLGHDIKGIDLTEGFLNELQSFQPDIVLIGLHGRFGEDGTVQGTLELLGYPYVGSGILASALAIDKSMTKHILKSAGIPVAKQVLINRDEYESLSDIFFEQLGENLMWPFIIKPNSEGSTFGLTLAHNVEEAKAGLDLALQYDSRVLIEEYIQGMEVTVAVTGDTNQPDILGVIEIIPMNELYDYHSKYQVGGSQHIIPARLEPEIMQEIESYAKKAYTAIHCQDYARIDFIIGKHGPIALEVNTLPGMTSTSLVPDAARAQGISFQDFLFSLVQTAYQRSISG